MAGRPSKYDPAFCQTIIEIGAQGGWLSEMAEACDVHRATMDNWAKEYPDFQEALTRAKQKAQAWFEKTGRVGMLDNKFNANLWQRQMAARHPGEYTERAKHEHTGKDGQELAIDVRQTARAIVAILGAAQIEEQPEQTKLPSE